MPVNYHQPSVNALFDAMPVPMLTFSINGEATYANRAAKLHPGKPVEAMGGKQVIKALARDITLGKIKLPYAADVELLAGHRLRGQFLPGPSGLDIAFVAKPDVDGASEASGRMNLNEIMAVLRDEVGPPMRKLSGVLGDLPETEETTELEDAAGALDMRLRRLTDLIAVFGEDVLRNEDRIELGPLVQAVVAELQPRAATLKIVFEVTEPRQTLPPLYGSERLIRRALFECFDNALTYSRREVNRQQSLSVKIAYNLTGEHVLMSVRNYGAIPDEFKGVETREPFAKLAKAPSSPTGGRLGLPLVHRIVGLHGGNMRMSMVEDDEVRVLIELPTGAPLRGQAQLDIAQAQRYATDLAQMMSRRKKEK